MEIKIEIDDLATFAKVAFIVDQPGVLKEIESIRNCWLKELIPYRHYRKWEEELHPNLRLTEEARDVYFENINRLETAIAHKEISLENELSKNKDLSRVSVIDYQLEYSLRKLGLNSIYKQLILRAIVCGEVRTGDYVSLSQHAPYEYGDWLFEGSFSRKGKRMQYYLGGDTIQKIKRNRRWYWMYMEEINKEKGAFNRIANAWNDRNPGDNVDDINIMEHGVSSYRKFLNLNTEF